MKIETHNIFHLLIFALFYNLTIAQNDIYFLINKNDSLIKLQISNEPKTYAGYRILYDERVKTRRNNTPIQKTSNGEVKVWVEDSKYDYFVYDNPFVSFSFIKEYDKLVNKEELNKLKIITDRKDFLKIGEKGGFDELGNNYFFLEKREKNKYLIRKVYTVIYE
ncbi:hypothetical protein [Algibacter lectus]|uniref:Uncharacterized protein n=1 Tax=Algibacter lectus TaxID=221126 RepID=A0A4R8MBH4_9FLAO|nr:hypothetical protein [Algibacter lectus]MDO7137190.1 hypothetical protein [Algibacter lectus]MWW24329.1 hypothetical protein [Algibacter lectus]TDY62348.1 hypothetical protein DFQ06_2184 [Algibacter lectus]SFC68168.1 hypothetical protein SAMN04489722_103156 [Algibacter lectus]